MIGLTPRQRQALNFINSYAASRQRSPTYEEIGKSLGLSRSGVHRLVGILVRRGFVSRSPHLSRSIVVSGSEYECGWNAALHEVLRFVPDQSVRQRVRSLIRGTSSV